MHHDGGLIADAKNRKYTEKITSVGGSLSVDADASLLAPCLQFDGESYAEIARCDYVLYAGDRGNYRAGCRGPLSAAQALAHWNRADKRANLFTAAIKKHMGESQ